MSNIIIKQQKSRLIGNPMNPHTKGVLDNKYIVGIDYNHGYKFSLLDKEMKQKYDIARHELENSRRNNKVSPATHKINSLLEKILEEHSEFLLFEWSREEAGTDYRRIFSFLNLIHYYKYSLLQRAFWKLSANSVPTLSDMLAGKIKYRYRVCAKLAHLIKKHAKINKTFYPI